MEALSRAGFICPDGRVSVLGFSAYGLNKYDSFLFRLPSSDGNFISFFNFITSITPTSSLNLLKSARHIPLSPFEHFVERCPHLGFFPSLPLFPLLGLLIQHFPFRISRMESARMSQVLKLNLVVFLLILLKAEGFFVPITYIEDAVAKGAVCLDGSPPAYHFDKGSGSGINNWLIHIEGGGWCNNVTTCLSRKSTRLGSSKKMAKQVAFSGMLSNKEKFNPEFYNWNRIKVRYCDGASFTGDVEAVDSDTNLHFRGARVFVAIIEDLLAKGMKNAENAVLSGCSAGGLTSILHCDRFRALIPASAKVKCFSDAGYFINAKDVSGAQHIERFYSQVVETHGSAKNLPRSCTSRLSPGLCFFPQYVISQITTPIFFINAAYDSWQIKNILAPGVADPHGRWHSCKLDINNCSPDQLTVMQGFRLDFLKAVTVLGNMPSKGMFIDSCYAHCQTEMQETWLRSDSPVLHNKTIAKAVGDWYYDRSPFHQIDCPYPCNPTCHNRVFEPDHPSSV